MSILAPDRTALERWLAEAKHARVLDGSGLSGSVGDPANVDIAGDLLYPGSAREAAGAVYAMLVLDGDLMLGISGRKGAPKRFSGVRMKLDSGEISFCPLTPENAAALREVLPFTVPSPLSSRDLSFGTGDRLGLANPGHIQAFRRYWASPVLAQQSVRELTLTNRTYPDVLDSAVWAVFREGYDGAWGADGDHLKTEEWVKTALSAGYTMITADVSDFIRGEWALQGAAEVEEAYGNLDADYRKGVEERYLPLSLPLDTGEAVRFSPEELHRTALVYREAVAHTARLFTAGMEVRSAAFDFELSIDETSTPTTPQAHVFMAKETGLRGVRVTSVAPRFVGEFQKAVDYAGDLGAFEASFSTHAAVARAMGHRISVHSGSDKFSVFPAIGRLTRGRFHIKTAGTSWLEALRVIAGSDRGLFRSLYAHALKTYPSARKLYHVTPDLDRLPDPGKVSDGELPGLLDQSDARQVLHISYGEILNVPDFHLAIYRTLRVQRQDYERTVGDHISRHLKLLGAQPKE
jgi:tagaturonate epimerase